MKAPEVSPHQAMRLISAGAALIDVREDDEWRAGHAPRARHLPLRSLVISSDPRWHGNPVVVLCRSGSRANSAATLLRARGVEAFAVHGGMQAWLEAHGPVMTSSGTSGRVI